MDISRSIAELQTELREAVNSALTLRDVEALKVKYLGKKGPIQALMASLKEVPQEARPLFGQKINSFKESVTQELEALLAAFSQKEQEAQLAAEKIDVTLPGRRRFLGRPHVTLSMLDEAIEILVGMGFTVQYGPHIESEFYNFEALNFAPDHPARDMQDTFYLSPDRLLRTHTSNTQVRVMEKSSPPIRVIAPGKCFRNEDVNARSHVVFHQIEGIYIHENVTFTDLLATLREFFTRLFSRDIKLRFRPSYFPFVEPGMEVDISCLICKGEGCSLCKQSGWLEVAGAGMIHPEVLKAGGIDPEVYSGYAWGFGIERLNLLKRGIKDIRLLFENRLQFLQQF